MRIAELYLSVQGEGLLTGTASVFIRTSGCNLRCWFCDTPFTSWQPEGEDVPLDEIIAGVEEWDADHVVITGGEPMLHAEMIPLCQALRRMRKHITIETAGTLYLPLPCDLMSISPKLSNSTPNAQQHPRWSRRHERERNRPDVVKRLMQESDYQLKFVVDTPDDVQEIENYLESIRPLDAHRVLLMPQGTSQDDLRTRASWLRECCLERGYSYCPRKHIEWYGLVRGT